jgi:3D (Asp-Asp-Asp) domain-containing protein
MPTSSIAIQSMSETAQTVSASPLYRRMALLACGLVCGLSGLAAVSQTPAVARSSTLTPVSASFTSIPPALQELVNRPVPVKSAGTSESLFAGAITASGKIASADELFPAELSPEIPSELLHDVPTDKVSQPKTLVAPTTADPAEVAPRYRVIMMEVTAYCPCTKCCGENAQGITASGKPVTHNEGRFVAADTRVLPFNTKLSIPGYHGAAPVPVLDRGGAIKGNKLDVYFDSHDTAKQWGRRMIPVRILQAE